MNSGTLMLLELCATLMFICFSRLILVAQKSEEWKTQRIRGIGVAKKHMRINLGDPENRLSVTNWNERFTFMVSQYIDIELFLF